MLAASTYTSYLPDLFSRKFVFNEDEPFCTVFAYAEEDHRPDDACEEDDEDAGLLLPARRRAADADPIRARKKQTVGTETTSTVDVEVK
jgi:hypothetical protein